MFISSKRWVITLWLKAVTPTFLPDCDQTADHPRTGIRLSGSGRALNCEYRVSQRSGNPAGSSLGCLRLAVPLSFLVRCEIWVLAEQQIECRPDVRTRIETVSAYPFAGSRKRSRPVCRWDMAYPTYKTLERDEVRRTFFGLLDIDYAVWKSMIHDLAKFFQLVVKVLTDADVAF